MNAQTDLHQCIQIMSTGAARLCHNLDRYGFSFTKMATYGPSKTDVRTDNGISYCTEFQADLLRYLHDL